MYLSELAFFFFSDIYPGVEFLGNMVALFFYFFEKPSVYIFTSSEPRFPFLQIFTSTCCLGSLMIVIVTGIVIIFLYIEVNKLCYCN